MLQEKTSEDVSPEGDREASSSTNEKNEKEYQLMDIALPHERYKSVLIQAYMLDEAWAHGRTCVCAWLKVLLLYSLEQTWSSDFPVSFLEKRKIAIIFNKDIQKRF